MNDIELRPSAAHRWTSCTQSPALSLPFAGENTKSPAAEEGTLAHEIAAKLLIDDIYSVDTKPSQDPAMMTHIFGYVDFVRSKLGTDGMVFIEHEVDLGDVYPGMGGTADAAVVSFDEDEKATLRIIDLKYGKGVRVHAEDNEQLALYAHGMLNHLDGFVDVDKIVMTIYQPRMDNIVDWELDTQELGARIDRIKTAAANISNEQNLVFAPNDSNCRWCPAKGTCKAFAKLNIASVNLDGATWEFDYEDLDSAPPPTPVRTMSTEDFVAVMKRATEITNWLKAVKAEALKAFKDGDDFGNYKFAYMHGGNRVWKDEEKAKDELKKRFKLDDIAPRKVIGPGAAEKLFKTKKRIKFDVMEELIERKEAPITFVEKSDKRVAVETLKFENLEGEDYDD